MSLIGEDGRVDEAGKDAKVGNDVALSDVDVNAILSPCLDRHSENVIVFVTLL